MSASAFPGSPAACPDDSIQATESFPIASLSDQFATDLPIDEVRQEFLASLDQSAPLVVVAPTGSGKSTRLPLWLADRYSGTVVVVEPRRVACRSLATYLSKVIGEPVGQTIGYRVRFDDRTTGNTRIVFATTGIVLRMLAGDADFDALLVDEFHERGWEVDLIGAIMLDALERQRYTGDLIFTSATVDAAGIAQQIGAEVVEARGRSFPVDITYRDDAPAPTPDGLDRRVHQAIADHLSTGDDDGDILVFLPGKGEISDCRSALRSLANRENIELIDVHGSLPPKHLTRAFSDHQGRRIFLSTNVAETSLTLPQVTTVIDSGLARMRIHRGGRSALALVPISEASMDQRAGRAGRLRPGQCIRLFSERFNPDAETRPEIQRIELDDVLLQAAECGLQGARFDDATWLTDPPAFAVDQARRRLRKMDAFDDNNRLTDRGQRMGQLPVGGDEARILLDPPSDLAATLADLVALIQLGRDLLLPRHHLGNRSQEGIKHARAELFHSANDEVYVQLLCLRHGHAHRHGLHRSALGEGRRIARSLRQLLGVTPADPTDSKAPLADPQDLAAYLLARIPESAFVARKRALKYRHEGRARPGRSEPWGNGDTELSIWPFDPPRPPGGADPDAHPVAGLVLDHFWLGDGATGVRGTGRMVLPCTYDQLRDAQIGTEKISDIRADRRHGSPYVRGIVERSHAGVVLERGEKSLSGPALHQAAAEAILASRLLRGAADKILDDLHVWELMTRFPSRDRTWKKTDPPPDPVDYLAARLQALGVKSDQDLMLVEAQDLRPDVAKKLGAYAYDVDTLAEEFPRIWEHQGKTYTCRVLPRRQKVILRPADKKTGRADDPSSRYLPSFRGYKVVYKNDSRTVPIRR